MRPMQWMLAKRKPLPPNAFSRSWRENVLEVLFPPSVYGRGASTSPARAKVEVAAAAASAASAATSAAVQPGLAAARSVSEAAERAAGKKEKAKAK
jgi:hypothetical protein